MVLIRTKYIEADMHDIHHDTQYLSRVICYHLGASARDTLKQWQEKGFRDYIEDEYLGIISEERQVKLGRLNLNELMDRFFFQDKRFYSWQIFPENRTQAMTDLEEVVVRTLETIPTDQEIKAGKPAKLTEVYQSDKGIYLPSQHTFQKHGKEHTVDIETNLEGKELGKLFFAADHPGSGSPALYFDHRIIYHNAPKEANTYFIGGAKVISVGKELEPNPSMRGRQTRKFIWSPLCANTKIVPVNFPEHTLEYDGFCIVPVKYFTVDDSVLQDIIKMRETVLPCLKRRGLKKDGF